MLADFDFEHASGPMPETLARAVARRRRAIRLRRAGGVGAALVLVGVGVWFALPHSKGPVRAERVVSGAGTSVSQPAAERFGEASLLALRLAGPDAIAVPPTAVAAQRDHSLLALRSQGLEGPL